MSLIFEKAHRFGLQVIAEGVEDRNVLMYLKKKGCDQVQGYYFSIPMLVNLFPGWLEAYQPGKDI